LDFGLVSFSTVISTEQAAAVSAVAAFSIIEDEAGRTQSKI